jgi:membrane-bound lytic murein transglycosylase D
MERIFAEEGVPTELTRLAFVESMFNPKAISKVGASGIWQFMPDTARQFMTVSRYIDERNSPLKASRAAARLLALNYRILGSWPLAVTAYNHGAGSLQRAIRKLGSNDFERILRDYDDRNFGFASKNFYAEFLSAKAIYQQKFRPSEPHSPNPLAITSLKLRRPVSLRQLTAAISREELLSHNPCILPAGINAFQSRPLPIGYELFVPINLRQKIQTAAIESSAHLYREQL